MRPAPACPRCGAIAPRSPRQRVSIQKTKDTIPRTPTMPKVLIAPAPMACGQGPFATILPSAGFELTYPPSAKQLTAAELVPLLHGVAAVIAGSEPYTRAVLEAAPQLRVIARAGVGYDAVDVAAATERGIAVTIAPGTNQDAVAELTFALLLAVSKRLV